jgi:hypothetical protein
MNATLQMIDCCNNFTGEVEEKLELQNKCLKDNAGNQHHCIKYASVFKIALMKITSLKTCA